jgi:hypothetical protein
MSYPSYKKSGSYKQFNTYTTATSSLYHAQVLQKHAHTVVNEKLLLSFVCARTLLRDLTNSAQGKQTQ